jgi:hypothetical protein
MHEGGAVRAGVARLLHAGCGSLCDLPVPQRWRPWRAASSASTSRCLLPVDNFSTLDLPRRTSTENRALKNTKLFFLFQLLRAKPHFQSLRNPSIAISRVRLVMESCGGGGRGSRANDGTMANAHSPRAERRQQKKKKSRGLNKNRPRTDLIYFPLFFFFPSSGDAGVSTRGVVDFI